MFFLKKMERIIEHIEYLLLQHDCVIIPDFGGFVLQTIPAEFFEESHLFTPAHKEIVFNPTLTHNDGLLIESYMQRYSLDFAKAQILVRKDVTEIKEHVDVFGELRLGSIGLFFKEEERLIFMPAKHSDELFSVQSFGLPVFNFLPLSAHQPSTISSVVTPWQENKNEVEPEKTPVRKNNVVYSIPISRTFLRVTTALAAAILLFLFLATPISDVNKSSYSASFVPQEIMPKKTADEIVTDAFSFYNNGINQADPTGNEEKTSVEYAAASDASVATPAVPTTTAAPATTASSATPTTSAAQAPPPSTAAAPKATTSTKGGMRYYVIIGSFNTKGQAQSFINRQKGIIDTTHVGIIVRDGHVRVYAQNFSTEMEAQSLVTKFRQNPKYKDTWLYSGQ